MSQQLVPDSSTPSDPELIAAVRAGDTHAYGVLFERHRSAALNLARQIAGQSDAEDLVSDAFMKVLRVLSTGGGPDVAFRAYLLTAVRRLHVDRIRAAQKVTPTDELEKFDPGTPFKDTAVDSFENAAAAKAFASLPERWQLVLWHLEVEGQKPAEIAPLLGMSANSVSALAYRAREGLRQAYLQMHMADTAAEQCRWVTERLGAYVRKGLSKRDAAKVDEHLDECPKCAAVYLELTEVNSNLSGIIAPALLGTAAVGYLASATGGGIGATGVAALVLKARHTAKAHSLMTAGGVAGGVAAAGVATVFVTQAFHRDAGDDGRRNTADTSIIETPVQTGEGPVTPESTPNGPSPSKGDPPSQNPQNEPTPTSPTTAAPPTSAPSRTTAPPPPSETTAPAETPPVVGGGQTPNPQDDDPPAPDDTDDPGLPPVTDPPPPPPATVDLSLALDVTAIGPGYQVVLDADTEAPATSVVVDVTLSEWLVLTYNAGAGWNCDPVGDTGLSCSIESADPANLVIGVIFPRATVPTLSASVRATGYDEDPDDLGNNTVSWTASGPRERAALQRGGVGDSPHRRVPAQQPANGPRPAEDPGPGNGGQTEPPAQPATDNQPTVPSTPAPPENDPPASEPPPTEPPPTEPPPTEPPPPEPPPTDPPADPPSEPPPAEQPSEPVASEPSPTDLPASTPPSAGVAVDRAIGETDPSSP
jgi:RNA polymerase sigma factor (sigma-70 family)